MNSNVFREIIINGPYYHTTFICSVQYLGDISPALHSLLDIAFVCKGQKLQDLQKLHKLFSNEETYEEFINIIKEVNTTPLYTTLVLNANSPRAPIGYMYYTIPN